MAGNFQNAGWIAVNGIARWNGSVWHPFGNGIGATNAVYDLATWDPDGPGPFQETVVVAGDGTPGRGIAMWDGTAWRTLGTGPESGSRTYALTTWDPDGPGPAKPDIIAGGSFQLAGGLTVNYIARWDGAAWHPLGTGMNDEVYALATWDPDGAGPQTDLLIAGGRFTRADGRTAIRLARWNGAAWSSMGSDFNNAVGTLAVHDPDGDGPAAAELIAAGGLVGAYGQQVRRWNGAAWQLLGSTNDSIASLRSFDPDGPGPAPADLLAVGDFTVIGPATVNGMARWDGAAWSEFTPPASALTPTPVRIDDIGILDPDDDGPTPAQLFIGGEFLKAGPLEVNRVAQWDGSTWLPLGTGPIKHPEAIADWDPDQDGPIPPRLVAAGSIDMVAGAPFGDVGYWDGSRWHSLGTGMNDIIWDVCVWDADGAGPLPPELIVGGKFTIGSGSTLNGVARWDGTRWRPMGAGLGTVSVLTTWDPDGQGPDPALLVAGGGFTTAAGVTYNGIAAWNGSAWLPFGSGLHSSVSAIGTWDPDGPGVLTPRLVAGGFFTVAAGGPANRIAIWDGSAWQPLGSGMSPTTPDAGVHDIIAWDPDDDGPASPQLIASGRFTTAGGVQARNIARWDGLTWSALGSGVTGSSALHVSTLCVWDADADGPAASGLFVAGDFTTAGGVQTRSIARWDGSAWYGLESGVGGVTFPIVWAMTVFDPDGSGPHPGELVMGGWFTTAGDEISVNWARWTSSIPWLARQPEDVATSPLGQVRLSCAAAPGLAGLTYAWNRDGQLVTNGPSGASTGGGVASGADTPSLAIDSVRPSDAGVYECVVSADCGTIVSHGAVLAVTTCPADLNGDGVIDFGDYLEFLNLYDALDPRADLNGDGVIDFGDYLEFLNHFDAGC